jgi:hypothetical protein
LLEGGVRGRKKNFRSHRWIRVGRRLVGCLMQVYLAGSFNKRMARLLTELW